MRGISRRDPFKMVQNLRVRRMDKRIRVPFALKWKNEPKCVKYVVARKISLHILSLKSLFFGNVYLHFSILQFFQLFTKLS